MATWLWTPEQSHPYVLVENPSLGMVSSLWLRELSQHPPSPTPSFFGTTNTNTTKGRYTPGVRDDKTTRKCRVVRHTNNTWSAIVVLCCDIRSGLVVVLRCDIIGIHNICVVSVSTLTKTAGNQTSSCPHTFGHTVCFISLIVCPKSMTI